MLCFSFCFNLYLYNFIFHIIFWTIMSALNVFLLSFKLKSHVENVSYYKSTSFSEYFPHISFVYYILSTDTYPTSHGIFANLKCHFFFGYYFWWADQPSLLLLKILYSLSILHFFSPLYHYFPTAPPQNWVWTCS